MYLAVDYFNYYEEDEKKISITALEYKDGVAYKFTKANCFETIEEFNNYLKDLEVDHIMTDEESFKSFNKETQKLLKKNKVQFY